MIHRLQENIFASQPLAKHGEPTAQLGQARRLTLIRPTTHSVKRKARCKPSRESVSSAAQLTDTTTTEEKPLELPTFKDLAMGSSAADNSQLDLVLDLNGKLLESPVWDARTQKLLFVDINAQQIHVFDPSASEGSTERHTFVELPEAVGFISLTEDPEVVLAAMARSIVTVSLTKKCIISELARTPEEHGVQDYRFNDGKPSPAGVLLAGRKHSSSEEEGGKRGRIYRLDWRPHEGESKLIEVLSTSEVMLPNGMAWNMDGGELYLNDTVNDDVSPAAGLVVALRVDEEGNPVRKSDGELDRRTVAKIPQEQGGPDGMTLDSEGRIWTALAKGAAVIALDPETGAELQRVTMPVRMPTACTFGGPNLEDMYITTTCLGGDHGTGGLWRYRQPGLRGHAPAYIARCKRD